MVNANPMDTAEVFRPLIELASILTEARIPHTASPGFVVADRKSFEKKGPAAIDKAGWDYKGRVFITLERDAEEVPVVVFEDRMVTKLLDEQLSLRKQELEAAEKLRNSRGRLPGEDCEEIITENTAGLADDMFKHRCMQCRRPLEGSTGGLIPTTDEGRWCDECKNGEHPVAEGEDVC